MHVSTQKYTMMIILSPVTAVVVAILVVFLLPWIFNFMRKNSGKRKDKDEAQLAKVYYDPTQPEAFGGAEKLEKRFPKAEVRKWLASQPTYTLHKPMRRRFTTRKYRTSGPDDLWQMDLMEMIPYARLNLGLKYILTCVDVFSRFARAEAVKTKDAKSVAAAIRKMLSKNDQQQPPRHIQTDLGKEFYNKVVQDLFKQKKINHYTVHSQFKAALVERFNRTLREKLNRFFTYQRNKKWTMVLPKIIDAYNRSSHRSLHGKRPVDVYIQRNLEDWEAQQETKVTRMKKNLYQVGALVRISRISVTSPFRKNFDQNWSEEIFRIASVNTKSNPVMYTLKDIANNEIIEGKFYREELQDVGDTLPSVYRIEKILQTRGTGKNKQYLVKWYGYDKSRNSWISQDQLVK